MTKRIHDLYNKDTFKWYNENAKFLREKKFDLIDIENLVEEIECMGKNEINKLENLFIILFLHLLKLKYQSDYEVGVRSWKLSVKEHRKRIKAHLKDNPSLKSYLNETSKRAYEYAILEAARETGLKEEIFPQKMPFTLEKALTDNWFAV